LEADKDSRKYNSPSAIVLVFASIKWKKSSMSETEPGTPLLQHDR
jgi:hypothetical protein